MYLLLLVCYVTSAVMGNVTPDVSTSHSQGASVMGTVTHDVITLQNQLETHAVVTSVEVHETQEGATDSKVTVHKPSKTYTYGTSPEEPRTLTQKEGTDHEVSETHAVVTSVEVHETQEGATDSKVTGFMEHYPKHSNELPPTQKHSGVTMKEPPSSLGKVQLPRVTSKSISIPNVSIKFIDDKFHIRCICEIGPEVIDYELILGDQVVKNMTVQGKQPALFQITLTSATSSKLYCRARTSSGEEETSQLMRILGDTTESEDKAGDKTKSDKEERDAEPKFLISLSHILTSVSQPVQDANIIIISVCGPVVLTLILIIVVIHFYKHREQKVEPTFSV